MAEQRRRGPRGCTSGGPGAGQATRFCRRCSCTAR